MSIWYKVLRKGVSDVTFKNFIKNLVARKNKGYLLHPVTPRQSSRLASVPCKTWKAPFKTLFIVQLTFHTSHLKLRCTTCRLELPKSIYEWNDCLYWTISLQNLKSTLGLSIEWLTSFVIWLNCLKYSGALHDQRNLTPVSLLLLFVFSHSSSAQLHPSHSSA